jgi:hypothetical protein
MLRTILALLLLYLAVPALAQKEEAREPNHSEALSNRTGTLLQEEMIYTGGTEKFAIEAIKVTDLLTGESSRMLLLVHNRPGPIMGSSRIKTAAIEGQEIDDLAKALRYMIDVVFKTSPHRYTEVNFKSRSGFEVGAEFDQKRHHWMPYMKFRKGERVDRVYFNYSELAKALDTIELARAKL